MCNQENRFFTKQITRKTKLFFEFENKKTNLLGFFSFQKSYWVTTNLVRFSRLLCFGLKKSGSDALAK